MSNKEKIKKFMLGNKFVTFIDDKGKVVLSRGYSPNINRLSCFDEDGIGVGCGDCYWHEKIGQCRANNVPNETTEKAQRLYCDGDYKNKLAYWTVKRYIVEEFSVLASSKKEALDQAIDPYAITITKETCIRKKK